MLISLVLSLLAADPACEAAFETLRTTNVVESGYSAHVGFVRARIGADGEPVWLLLDTGANRSALDAGFARRAGLPVLAGSRVEGTAGVIEAGGTRVEDLRLGDLRPRADRGRPTIGGERAGRRLRPHDRHARR